MKGVERHMQKKIFARSNQNGIDFCSNVLEGSELKAYFDDDDKFVAEKRLVGPTFFLMGTPIGIPSEVRKKNKKLGLAIGIALMALSVLTLEFSIILAAFYFGFLGVKEILNFISLVKLYRTPNEKGRTIARFLAAKQKVLNAYAKKDNSIPNTEEVKKASPFSKDCEVQSTIRTVVHTIIFTGILCLSALNAWLYLGVVIIYLILYALETKFSYLRVLQFVFMQEPTDKEIALAIEGLRELEIMENEFSENFGDGGIVVSFGDDGGFVMTMAIHFGSEEPGEDGETVMIKEHIEISDEEDSES